jgi:uncharacterized protein YcbK (DUF882 family)
MKLTDNFTLAEFTESQTASRRGFDNTPPAEVVPNLIRTAKLLEQVRKAVGKPINITSGYRSKQLNDAIGSNDRSQHRVGCAADFKVAKMTPDEVVQAIVATDIQYDQLIREFDSWVHISVPNNENDLPKNQTLIIDKQGTRLYS